jgi:hypothetical protein
MRRPARCALLLMVLAPACTRRLYEGPQLSPEEVAVIQVGTTTVREIDGEHRRGGAFDVSEFEVAPGHHRLLLVLELPARSVGMKTIPAQAGAGVCVLEFNAEAGRQYFLGSRPRGDWPAIRWDGAWEGWVRDPSISSDDDVIARCSSQPAPEAAATPAVAAPSPPPAAIAAAPPSASPVVAAAAPAPTPSPAVAAAPTARPRAATAIRLGEWNLRSLGRGSDKDLTRVAAAIEANFDILAVTEVLQIGGGHPGYDALLRALGPAWEGQIASTPRPNTAADGAEYYAILYRRDRVRPCSGWDGLRYVPDNDGSGNTGGPDHFLREPAFGCFEAGAPSAPGVDFLLAVYRAPTADGDAAETAAEVGHLDEVFTAMRLARPGEDDLIIAGDFHLESVELPRVTSAADRTRGDGSLLNLLGDRNPSLPDHILVSDPRATAEMLGDAEPLDVRGVAPSNAEFYRTVSDHLPIMVRLRSSGPDDD